MVSIGIITVNFGRPKVLQLWLAMIKRLRNDTQFYIPAVVVSEEYDKAICNEYKVWHITHPNKPVTEKFNRAFKYMQGQNVDYCMITGSDDNFSTGFYNKTLQFANQEKDYIGTQSLYFYAGDGQYRGRLVKLTSTHTLGIGKTISKTILDQCDWRLWDTQRNWGMDAIATRTILKYAKSKAWVDDMIVDVKTSYDQLNRFQVWGNRLPQIAPQEFYKQLSEEELQILKSL
jgi:hypothetical protein